MYYTGIEVGLLETQYGYPYRDTGQAQSHRPKLMIWATSVFTHLDVVCPSAAELELV